MFDEFFSLASQLQKEGKPFATAEVIRSEKPTSGRPGDRAIITADGVLSGWIGGSCAQPTVIQAALAAIKDGRSRLIRLSPDDGTASSTGSDTAKTADTAPEGFEEMPMTCFSGGTLDVFIEPQAPQPRLLVVGDLPVARSLAYLGKAMNYHVIAVVSESGKKEMAHTAVVRTDLDAIAELATSWTFVVVATHGHFDEPAVAAALRSPASYVGLVASHKRASSIKEYLVAEGLAGEIERLHVPAGLDIGAERGDEIALSIMAEIVQERRSTSLVEDSPGADEVSPDSAKSRAIIDPVCGMTVTVGDKTPSVEHDGMTYYFCCQMCATRFGSEPAEFLAG